MFILGLTGSIAWESRPREDVRAEGVPVHDADAVVHALYDGEATPAIEAAFPGTTANGKVDREKLGKHVFGDAAAIARLEQIVHPLVAKARDKFLSDAARNGAKSPCWISRCSTKPKRRALRRGGGGLGAGRRAAPARFERRA